MAKRILALLLSLMMLFTLLVSCGGEEAPAPDEGDKPSQGDEQKPEEKPDEPQ